MSTLPIKTQIKKVGQSYVDEPVYLEPAKRLFSPIAESVAEAFGNVRYYVDENNVGRRERTDVPKRILSAYQMVKLNWVKPSCKGAVTPR